MRTMQSLKDEAIEVMKLSTVEAKLLKIYLDMAFVMGQMEQLKNEKTNS